MLYWVHADTATVSPREETNGPWTINKGNLRLRGNYHWYQYFLRKFYSMNLNFALPCGTIFFPSHIEEKTNMHGVRVCNIIKLSVKTLYFFVIFCCFMSYSQWILVKTHPIFKFFKNKVFFKNHKFWSFSLAVVNGYWSKIMKFGKFLIFGGGSRSTFFGQFQCLQSMVFEP